MVLPCLLLGWWLPLPCAVATAKAASWAGTWEKELEALD